MYTSAFLNLSRTCAEVNSVILDEFLRMMVALRLAFMSGWSRICWQFLNRSWKFWQSIVLISPSRHLERTLSNVIESRICSSANLLWVISCGKSAQTLARRVRPQNVTCQGCCYWCEDGRMHIVLVGAIVCNYGTSRLDDTNALSYEFFSRNCRLK